PLPRPPAWICDLRTTTGLPVSWTRGPTAATASSTVVADRPSGTATPNGASSSLAWYSWIFKVSIPPDDAGLFVAARPSRQARLPRSRLTAVTYRVRVWQGSGGPDSGVSRVPP